MGKTVILTHGDCDGICAGAIALSMFPGSEVYFTRPVALHDDLQKTEADKIIIADIAMSRPDTNKTVKALKERGSDIMYFDHHTISPDARKTLEKNLSLYKNVQGSSASELIYKHFQKDIPRERVWIALYGAIGDYSDETDFVKERLLNWDRRAIYFEVSTISLGTKNEQFSGYDEKRHIVESMARGNNPSDIQGLVQSAKEAVNREFDLYGIVKRKAAAFNNIAYVRDIPSFGFRGPSALFSATVKNTPVGIAAYTRESGYVDITIRTRDYSLKLNDIADDVAEKLGGSGGGHPHAAGAKIPDDKFKLFLEMMDKKVSSGKKHRVI